MKTLLQIKLALLLAMPLTSFSMGGQWLLKVQFSSSRNLTTAYIPADYYARDYPQSMYDNPVKFKREFLQRFGHENLVTMYADVKDHRELADAAPFPMYPWEYDYSSEFQIDPHTIEYIRLDEVWVRDDYHIVVMNTLTAADTLWFSDDYLESYPVGQEVGCRLMVCDFGKGTRAQELVRQLVATYDRDRGWLPGQMDQVQHIIAELTREKVIVVELCGC